MRAPRKILHPTDCSEQSMVAFPLAWDLARRFGAELHLLYVVVLHERDPFKERSLHSGDVTALAQDKLDRLRGKGKVVNVIRAVRRGVSAYDGILSYASEQDVDLVAMASKGRSGLSYVLLGSVVRKVVYHAEGRPVLCVRSEFAPADDASPGRFDDVIVPIDFSESSTEGARAAALFADEGARITVVHVVRGDHPRYTAAGKSERGSRDPEFRRNLEQQLQQFVTPHLDGRAFSVRLLEGRPSAAIARHAREEGASLITMTFRGYDEIGDYLVGSTTERTLRSASCPVLVV